MGMNIGRLRSFAINDFLHAIDELHDLQAPKSSGHIIMGASMEPSGTQE
jgi:hypothetical protein